MNNFTLINNSIKKDKFIIKYQTVSDLNIYHFQQYLLLFQSYFGTKLLQLPIILNYGLLLNQNQLQIQFFFQNQKRILLQNFFLKFIKKILRLNIKPLIFGISLDLVLQGIGFRVYFNKKNQILAFKLGYSHKIYYKLPIGFWIRIFNRYSFTLFGCNYSTLKQIIIKILKFKKPNNYTGKGIKLKITQLKLKQGKKQI